MLLRTRRTLIVATPDSLVRAPIVRDFEPERENPANVTYSRFR